MEEKKLDKDINVRSKTELSDEKIIKALGYKKEEILEECDRTGNSVDDYICGLDANVVFGVYDLIHRLQNTIEKQCEVFEKLENSYGELVEEHANLKERYVKVLDLNEKVIAEQKAEIERLTEENKKLTEENRIVNHNLDFHRNEKFKLQKQVDELKERSKLDLECEKKWGKLLKEQAVKDTAKEILQRLQCFGERDEGLRIDLLDIADEYGVEVE